MDIVILILLYMNTSEGEIFNSLGTKWETPFKLGQDCRKLTVATTQSIINMHSNGSVHISTWVGQDKQTWIQWAESKIEL
jgi:hypothetical protein